ncbi:radical SAM-superfamily protein, partial [human gut metagenome]
MKQTNISVFIPHYGCTHICSFCNQKTISGHSEPVTEKELESILEGQLENLKDSGTKAQIAFFGGSFTAIDRDYMIRLLTVAKRYTDAYPEQYDGIRCSTRPDCIDEEILG